MQGIDRFTFEDVMEYFGKSVGALLVADENADRYRSIVRRGVFQELLAEEGTYNELVQRLWFHFYNSEKRITEEYQVFIPNLAKFVGKYSKRLKLVLHDIPHIVQMMIQPIDETGLYLFVLDELDEKEYADDMATQQKVSTIQNIYLFSMCFDLVRDTTSSLSLTEVSDETMNSQISYSVWRETIVNMIWEGDQKLFRERSDPDYLRTHFQPGQMESFECQMQNLEGKYIWVKLIFSRMDTTNENDFRFVYMVQNVHEATVNTKATIKHYEELASRDSLTQIFNHGRIETELCNAIEQYHKDGKGIALLILDIDHFKSINDRFGHTVGDTTLVHLAETIRDELSNRKTAIGRWGGEEFAAVLYDVDSNALEPIAEQLRMRIEKEHYNVVELVTCSIGAAMLERADTAESWFDRADAALYEAKDSGRNRVCLH